MRQVIEREELALYEQQMAAAEAGAAEARRRHRRMREVGFTLKMTVSFHKNNCNNSEFTALRGARCEAVASELLLRRACSGKQRVSCGSLCWSRYAASA